MDLTGLMIVLLDHNCGNPSSIYDGYNEYRFEGHCVEYIITARKVDYKWDVLDIDIKDM